MPPMPYCVTQGPIITALEEAFNRGHKDAGGTFRTPSEMRVQTLNDLRQGMTIGAAGNFLNKPIAEHIDLHWFGIDPATGQPLASPGPTGWWVNWRGPAEDIAREGMIVGLEVALGLDHGQSTQHATLPGHILDFSWICPVPRFEVWTGCRDWGSGGRVVTVTLATPGFANVSLPPEVGTFQPLAADLSNNAFENGPAYQEPNEHIVVGAARTAPFLEESLLTPEGNPDSNQWKILLNVGISAGVDPTKPGSPAVVIHRPDPSDGIDPPGLSFKEVTK